MDRSIIREPKSKLRSIDQFLSHTNQIYHRAEDQLKQVGFPEGGNQILISAVSAEWLLELNRKSAEQFLLSKGVTETEIGNLDDMGFTPEEIKEMYLLLRTDSDREMFTQLIRGEYIPAFQIDPDSLSDEIHYMLVYYTNTLIENNQAGELEKLINGMLYTDEVHSWYPNELNQNAFGQEYLNGLYAVSGKLLEQEAGILMAFANDMDADKKMQLCKEIERLSQMNALWGTLREVSTNPDFFHGSGIESQSLQLQYGFCIDNLQQNSSGLAFVGEFQTARLGDATMGAAGRNISELEWYPDHRLLIQTDIVTEASEIRAQAFLSEMREIRKKQENLWMKYAGDAGIAGLAVFSQGAAAALGLVKGLSEGSGKTTAINGWKSLEESKILPAEFLQKYGGGSAASLKIAGG